MLVMGRFRELYNRYRRSLKPGQQSCGKKHWMANADGKINMTHN